MFTLDNIALISAFASDGAEEQMKTIIEGNGSVVHAWSERTNVSPRDDNRRIRGTLSVHEQYEGYELPGDHSISNVAALNGALMRRARELKYQ
jgi:hypothetical protein